jgi:hypothetical protein
MRGGGRPGHGSMRHNNQPNYMAMTRSRGMIRGGARPSTGQHKAIQSNMTTNKEQEVEAPAKRRKEDIRQHNN